MNMLGNPGANLLSRTPKSNTALKSSQTKPVPQSEFDVHGAGFVLHSKGQNQPQARKRQW
jgi:hypothetical protein